MVSYRQDSNSYPLVSESSGLSVRPRLLACFSFLMNFVKSMYYVFRNSLDPIKDEWPPKENGNFLKIERFPCQLQSFAKYLPELKKIFKIKEEYSEEARKR